MLHSERLPDFVFIDKSGKETRLALSAMTPRIRAVAAHIRSRVKPGSTVGLMFASEPNLIVNWLSCLAAKVSPLVMQYPTKKQSRAYWTDSVTNTIQVADMAAILADDYCAGLGLAEFSQTITQEQLDALPDEEAEPLIFDDFSIIQLSSGTTGYRKAIRFGSEELRRHVADYNEVLGLTKVDKVVSWLPLYHDMGYVACFVMPMFLGIDTVMMDPMTWVGKPELVYGAIERHSGTICYMPNFGFELMSRLPAPRLPSMRWWISCSEPVSAETARKFLANTGAKPNVFAPCYAMAENIFAVSIRRGLQTQTIDGVEVVSCGKPIPGVRIKIVDEEVWVSSPTSLKAYIGGVDIRDPEGFYPTGDLGTVIDGELYVTGRKQDLLIQAGKKFMLSDIDLTLNRIYPDIRGRAVAVQFFDERIGTQKPVVLIESDRFFLRKDQQDIAAALSDALGLDQIEVHFVPPRFLTKTSSGKFNRKKSAENWLLVQKTRRESRPRENDTAAELRDSFATVPWDKPVEAVLDSLSITILRFILADTPVEYDGQMSLSAISARLARPKVAAGARAEQAIHIVSLANRPGMRRVINGIRQHDFLSRKLGETVIFEHLCLPPSPIILSDLIFHDYFQPRLDPHPFLAVNRAFDKLRNASIILVDDWAEMMFPPFQTYAALSHNLERDPTADLVVTRWQRYAQHHDVLPLTVVAGRDVPIKDRTAILSQLGAYLNKPIFRMALIKAFAEHTGDWEYQAYESMPEGKNSTVDPNDFAQKLAAWIKSKPEIERKSIVNSSRAQVDDMDHYCSHLADKGAVDRVLSKYQSFCIVGQNASVPYVRRQLDRLGKPYVQAISYAPEVLTPLKDKFECLLICGAMGKYPISVPAAAIMFVQKWQTLNMDAPDLKNIRFKNNTFRSLSDWFYPLERKRGPIADEVRQARLDLGRGKPGRRRSASEERKTDGH